ncbi:MAG: response regulator transcription factor [Cyanobacteriota bacterium]|nr:response regulator transcription factor [Cyanobacteriota bacterium]
MKKILIVDDDRTFRMTLKRYLGTEGYQVEAVDSGTDALTLFEAEPPDLVVSDIMMPEMDGFEFCRRLRATRLGQLVPFIFLSSLGELDNRIEGHSIGADDYLIKPFEPRELVAKIEAQLERSRRIHLEIHRLVDKRGSDTPKDRKSVQQNDTDRAPVETADPESLPLTPAEVRVFWEVIQGFTNKEIADRLFVSPRTVQTHLSHILNKLSLANRAQLVRFAFEKGYQRPTQE